MLSRFTVYKLLLLLSVGMTTRVVFFKVELRLYYNFTYTQYYVPTGMKHIVTLS